MSGKLAKAKLVELTTRDRIKHAAQQLIGEHGVDGVSVRDIVTVAGQKNMASLYYYFHTKEELIKELIVDASELMEGRRAEALAELEAVGDTPVVRDIIEIIIAGASLDPHEGGRNATVMRFLGAVVATHRHLYDDAIGNRYNHTYQRCLDLIRQCRPDIPSGILNQRLLFCSICSFNLLIAREGGVAAGGHAHRYWNAVGTSYNILDFLCGAVEAPVSPEAADAPDQDIARRRHMVRHFTVLAS